MFNCNECVNQKVCKYIEKAAEVQEDIKALKIKHKHFYGSIDARCDYFVPDKRTREIACSPGP